MPGLPPSADTQLFVGIDIAATSAAVALMRANQPVQKSFTITQDLPGFVRLKDHLLASGVAAANTVALLESTSTYWIQIASYLYQQGFQVVVVNPAQAHSFAKSLLKRSKTDPIDAQSLAELATCLFTTRRLQLWSPPPQVYHELHQRLNQRDNLLKMRQQFKNQLHALQASGNQVPSVVERQQRYIAELEADIKQLEQELAVAVAQDPAWAASVKRLRSIKGVGLLTACVLVTNTLNYSLTENAAQAAAYAGLAPRERRSGTSVRGAGSIGEYGDERLRVALYNASISATRHNPLLREFHQRLLARGKAKKVARCAVMRKMAGIAFALVHNGTGFDANYGRSA
jgi:transposase